MAGGVPDGLRKRALVVVPRGYPAGAVSSAEVLFSSHPEPDGASLAAARRALDYFEGYGPKDVILCLISGGTSSLLALPRPGVTLESKRRAVRRLMRSGASIVEINRLRKSLSAVKGGKLGRKTRARLVTLVLSDVPGDRPSLVGSGPTIRGIRGDVTLVVGSNRSGLDAAARLAREKDLAPRVRRGRLSGEAHEQGRRFARSAARLGRGQVLLAGGETTVTIRGAHGRGGRNLEFALGAALGTFGHRRSLRSRRRLGRHRRQLASRGRARRRPDDRAGAPPGTRSRARSRASRHRGLLRTPRRSARSRPDGNQRLRLGLRSTKSCSP